MTQSRQTRPVRDALVVATVLLSAIPGVVIGILVGEIAGVVVAVASIVTTAGTLGLVMWSVAKQKRAVERGVAHVGATPINLDRIM